MLAVECFKLFLFNSFNPSKCPFISRQTLTETSTLTVNQEALTYISKKTKSLRPTLVKTCLSEISPLQAHPLWHQQYLTMGKKYEYQCLELNHVIKYINTYSSARLTSKGIEAVYFESRYGPPDGMRETSRRPSLSSYQPETQAQQVLFRKFGQNCLTQPNWTNQQM